MISCLSWDQVKEIEPNDYKIPLIVANYKERLKDCTDTEWMIDLYNNNTFSDHLKSFLAENITFMNFLAEYDHVDAISMIHMFKPKFRPDEISNSLQKIINITTLINTSHVNSGHKMIMEMRKYI